MDRRKLVVLALSGALVAATAFIPAAQASNVAWSVSVGGPGFAVSAGEPAFYGGYGYGAPYRPYYRPWHRPAVVVPPVAYPYYAPAPVVYAPRPIIYAPRPVYYAPRVAYANPGFAVSAWGGGRY